MSEESIVIDGNKFLDAANQFAGITIKKAKIKDDLFLETEYAQALPGFVKKDIKLTCTIPVHDDLKESFQKLHTHLAVLCGDREVKKKEDIEEKEFPGFHVRGFTIGGSGEDEGVTISGYKEGPYGIVNLNTPFAKFENMDYPHSSELGLAVQSAIYEVEQYLFNGKRAPEKQIEMEFGEADTQAGEDQVTE